MRNASRAAKRRWCRTTTERISRINDRQKRFILRTGGRIVSLTAQGKRRGIERARKGNAAEAKRGKNIGEQGRQGKGNRWIIRKCERATAARFSVVVAPWRRETHNLRALLPRYMTFRDANDDDYTLLPSDPVPGSQPSSADGIPCRRHPLFTPLVRGFSCNFRFSRSIAI